jgi:alpha-beta hydrolase superfamily lysophospholipase
MRDLNAALDQSTIENLHCKLPFLGATLTSADYADLRRYLSFYQLPQPSKNLLLSAEGITVGENHIVTMAWQPSNSIGTAIVVHGYMDHMGLFNHLIQDLLKRQLTVVCFDLPGHGLSTGKPGYILDYADYVSALESVINLSREKFSGPLHGVGQSMGGAILLKHSLSCHAASKIDYPFTSLNLLAPLLQPRGWSVDRWLYLLTKSFIQNRARVFRPSSWDQNFLYFLRYCDPLQAKFMPLAWVGALKKWIEEFRQFEGSNLAINLIQGDADKTLNWESNLKVFKQKFPALNVHIIKDGNHHLVNEIESMREDIFSALRF